MVVIEVSVEEELIGGEKKMKREMGEEINTYVAIDLYGIFDFDRLKYTEIVFKCLPKILLKGKKWSKQSIATQF